MIYSRILTRIFEELNSKNIAYCHWKSNAFLKKSFDGKTDFDLLVAREDSVKFQLIMSQHDFKRRKSSPDNIYPGMEDYIGFDEETGKLIHLHIHYKLVLGRKYSKNYRVPIENLVLDSSILHDEFPIKIIIPEIELILLSLRAVLKTKYDIRSIAKMLVNNSILPENIREEFEYLFAKINHEKYSKYADLCFSFNSQLLVELQNIIKNGAGFIQFIRIQLRLIKIMNKYRIYAPADNNRNMKIRMLSLEKPRKSFVGGGIAVAFVGVDGSGKSTSVSTIIDWLSWKLSVKYEYMGLPKDVIWKILNRSASGFSLMRLGFLSRIINDMKWTYIANKRYKLFNESLQLKDQDYIVVFDRYPLKEFQEMDEPMDGPRLSVNSFWGKLERHYYDQIDYPDYVFVLKVCEQEAVNRKSEHRSEEKKLMIKRKINIVDKLIENEKDCFVIIDTSMGQDKAILEIKKKLWEVL